MKSSSFDLEELNYWNKNLDISLDVSERNLDSFLHETCLLAKFSYHLWKIISLSYDIVFWLKCGKFIDLWVRNPKQLSLHQLDFCSSNQSKFSNPSLNSPLVSWIVRPPCGGFLHFSLLISLNLSLILDFSMVFFLRIWWKLKLFSFPFFFFVFAIVGSNERKKKKK